MQALALLICHNPRSLKLEGASVYIPKGKWRLGLEEVKDSEIDLHVLAPPLDWVADTLVSKQQTEFISRGMEYRIYFRKLGSEKSITIMAYSCH